MNHPIPDSLCKKLQRKHLKVEILIDNFPLEETITSQPFPAQAFFLLPL